MVVEETPLNFLYVHVQRHLIYDFNDIIVEIHLIYFGYMYQNNARRKDNKLD